MNLVSVSRPPKNLAETGLPEALLKELLLKHLYDGVTLDLPQLRDRLKLPGNIIEPLLQSLRKDQRVHANSPLDSASGVRYILTELGQADAATAFLRSGYVGPAPITLEHYLSLVSAQSVFDANVCREQVHAVFKNVVIDPSNLDVLGPALHSGKGILIYGPAGTGKTYICKKMAGLLGGDIFIPYAIAVEREIVQFFDPMIHQPLEDKTASASLSFAESTDARLLRCRRPVAISGGELTMDRLELSYDSVARICYAPIQMKANNGIYLIDDMGRQRMQPVELFNRWIVPMEEHRDYLALPTGKHFSVPFDCVLIFSTNLAPTDLADEAFLRRLGYKIAFSPISKLQFTQIWNALLTERQVSAEEGITEALLDRFAATERDLLPCHPRDLMDIALDIGAYLQAPGIVTHKNIMLAWDTYFVKLKE